MVSPHISAVIRIPARVAHFDACLWAMLSSKRELSMTEHKQELWRELCEMAIVETDPHRVTELFQQIDQLLSEDNRPDGNLPQDGNGRQDGSDRQDGEKRPDSDILHTGAA